jgi:malate permease and related proteins
MKEFLALAGAVLPVFAIVPAGLVLRRLNWLTEEADHSLLRICINLFIPALIFASILGNETLRHLDNLLIPPVIGFGAASAGISIAWIVSRWSGASNRDQRASFALAAGLQNYVYYALPIIALLYDQGTVGVLFLHNVGVDAVLWTVGVAVLSSTGWAASWRGLLNAPIITL